MWATRVLHAATQGLPAANTTMLHCTHYHAVQQCGIAPPTRQQRSGVQVTTITAMQNRHERKNYCKNVLPQVTMFENQHRRTQLQGLCTLRAHTHTHAHTHTSKPRPATGARLHLWPQLRCVHKPQPRHMCITACHARSHHHLTTALHSLRQPPSFKTQQMFRILGITSTTHIPPTAFHFQPTSHTSTTAWTAPPAQPPPTIPCPNHAALKKPAGVCRWIDHMKKSSKNEPSFLNYSLHALVQPTTNRTPQIHGGNPEKFLRTPSHTCPALFFTMQPQTSQYWPNNACPGHDPGLLLSCKMSRSVI